MTNTELIASLRLLKLHEFIITPMNHRFLLSINPRKVIYIKNKFNTFILCGDKIPYSETNSECIDKYTLNKLIKYYTI